MREKIVDLLEKTFDKQYDKNLVITAYSTANYLVAHDVIQVVRCKDCKHYDNSEGIQWCSLNSKFAQWGTDWHSFPEDGFCSYGERKDNERLD